MRSLARLLLPIVPLIAGCSMVLPQSGPVAVGEAAAPAPEMVFPECQTVELAFAGESTLAAIGLGEVGGPDADKVGMIWVTAGPAGFDMAPVPAGGGKGLDAMGGRIVCVQWPDGNSMAAPVPDEWVPPAADAVVGSSEAAEGPPIGVLVLIGGAVILIGASVLAFRQEGA